MLLFATSDEDSRDRTVALISEGGGRAWSRIPGSVLSRSQHGLQVVGTAGQRPGVAADRLVVYLAADGNLRTDDLYARERNQTIWAAFIDRDMVASINGWPFFAGEATGEEGARQVTVDETLALATRAGRRSGLTSNAAVTTLALPGGTAGGLEAQPVFVDPAGAGKHFLVSWCPSTNSYIAAKTHERTGLGLFSSATPWGPWETLWYGRFVERGAIFTAQVVTMWSTDGTVALMWSGSPDTNASHNLDAVYLTRFSVGQEQELSVPGLRRYGSPELTASRPSGRVFAPLDGAIVGRVRSGRCCTCSCNAGAVLALKYRPARPEAAPRGGRPFSTSTRMSRCVCQQLATSISSSAPSRR